MKLIGILGGMTAASTALYCDRLNREAGRRLGDGHAANLLVRSVDFAELRALVAGGGWEAAGTFLHREALALEGAGADLLIVASNTPHIAADRITLDLRIPFLHIADAAADALLAEGHARPGILATRDTLEADLYGPPLRAAGMEPVLPGEGDREALQALLDAELFHGRASEASRTALADMAERLRAAGADCLLLACTELGLALGPENVTLPLLDTLAIHCDKALDLALALEEAAEAKVV